MNSNFKAIRMFVFLSVLFLFTAGATKIHTHKTSVYASENPNLAEHASSALDLKPDSYIINRNNQKNRTETWVAKGSINSEPEMIVQKNDARKSTVSEKTEDENEELPEIIGTSWSLLCIYEKGTQPKYMRNFPEYLFCKNGRWELHSLTNSMGQMGTYTVKGDQLITVHDGADKLTAKYKITWNAAEKYLELNDGKLIFRLRYRTKTKC